MAGTGVGDISQYNRIGAYGALKKHFDGMIIRIGYRGYSAGTIKEDALFEKHTGGIERNGIPYGFYFMSQAVTESEAAAEAEYCHRMIGARVPAYPVYYDSELSSPKGSGRADSLSRRQRTDIALAFCRRMEELGRRAGVYASKSWFETRLYAGELKQYSIWVAQYNSVCKYTETDYDMWQYTDQYKVPGLSCVLDRSYSTVEPSAAALPSGEGKTVNLKNGTGSYSLGMEGDCTIVNGAVKTNFRVREFRCRDGSDKILIDGTLVEKLQQIRDHFGQPVSITSAYRTVGHNKSVDGAAASYHIRGQAADITVTGVTCREVARYAEGIGVKGIGLYDYTGGFVHIDTREKEYFWQQDSRNGRSYPVTSFGGVRLYLVKGKSVETVRYNSRGNSVRLLQEALGIKADGIFGAGTEEAVRIFQRTHGLAVDGVAGPRTWEMLL